MRDVLNNPERYAQAVREHQPGDRDPIFAVAPGADSAPTISAEPPEHLCAEVGYHGVHSDVCYRGSASERRTDAQVPQAPARRPGRVPGPLPGRGVLPRGGEVVNDD